jgi:hypothetical protein
MSQPRNPAWLFPAGAPVRAGPQARARHGARCGGAQRNRLDPSKAEFGSGPVTCGVRPRSTLRDMVSASPRDEPAGGSRRPSADNGGGFVRGKDGDQVLAEIRARAGDEVAEQARRSLKLSRRPRPLTDEERAVVCDTAAPLVRDLGVSGLDLPDIRFEALEDRGRDAVCALIQGPGPERTGIWILLRSAAEQVTELAEQFQNWAADQLHDAGKSPEWPVCPEHPASHRLNPEVRDGVAVWTCWEGDHVVWEIGALTRPGVRAAKSSRRKRRA